MISKRENMNDKDKKVYNSTQHDSINSELIKELHNIAKFGFWSYDFLTKIVYWSQEIYNILECRPIDLSDNLGSYLEYIHIDDYGLVKEYILKMSKGEENEIEYRITTTSKSEKYLREKSKVILNENSEPVRMIGYIQDITYYKNKENYLSVLNNDLVAGQRVSCIGSWKYNVREDRYYGSDEMYTIYGITKAEFSSESNKALLMVHPDDRVEIENAMKANFSGRSVTIQYRIPQNNGRVKYVVSKSEPIYNEDGQVELIIGTLQDITENNVLEQKLRKSLELINKAEGLAHIGSWESNLITGETQWSEETCRIFGLSIEEMNGSVDKFKTYVHPDDMYIVDDVLDNPRKGPIELHCRLIRENGELVYIYEMIEYVFDESGLPTHIYGIIQDITEKKYMSSALKQKDEKLININNKFETILKESVEVFEILDRQGNIIYISQAAENIIGFTPSERIGKSVFDLHDSDESIKLREMFREALLNPNNRYMNVIKYTTKSRKNVYLEFYMQNYLSDPAVKGIAVTIRDISDRIRSEKRILHILNHDRITNLPNKTHFEQKLKEILKTDIGTDYIAVALFEVTNDRYIKDHLGHEVSDEFFVQIANRMKSYCDEEIYLCRYSDNCFLVLVEGININTTITRIIDDLYLLFETPIVTLTFELDVEMNCGVSILNENEKNYMTAIRQSETALYLAKNERKRKYKIYSSNLDIQSYKSIMLRNDLKKSIENNNLRAFFQPLVKIKTNEILGAEVLLRWEHPRWGLVSPLEFITIAEETGYIIKIGDWIINNVCKVYKEWIDAGLKPIKISINYSSTQFFEIGFVEKLIGTIHSYGLAADFLIIEITESIVIENIDLIKSNIKKLKSYGIQIALDDFGTGYSSLAYLASLDIDILKIDGSFIQNIRNNNESTLVLRHIINLAKDLKIKIVAEKIEEWDQLVFLKNQNCYAGQGYIYSKPIPVSEFRSLLSKSLIKPIRKYGQVYSGEERRKYFRLNFRLYLESTLTILEIGGDRVNIGNTKVLIKDIGPGGLCYISNLKLPVDKDILLQFSTELLSQEVHVNGTIVWNDEFGDSIFRYGVEFHCDDNKRTELVKIFSIAQIKMRNDIMFADGNFVSENPFQYFRLDNA